MKTVLLIGTQPERMIRLRRTFASLSKLGIDTRVFRPYRKPSGSPRIIKGIVRYLLTMIQVALTKSDIYHFFNVPDIVGVPLLWKRGVFIYDVRSPWFSSIKESLGISLLSRIAGFIERIVTSGADFVVTANYPLAQRAKKWRAKHVVVVPNYPPPDFGPVKNREGMRRELGLGDAPTVLYLGKISKIEGSELLKHIIYETSQAVPSVRFLIVGDGPERDSLEHFVKKTCLENNVMMTGWIMHSKVADYINAADICLLPRKWDSFSPYTAPENITKAAEYLAMGKPIIAPRMGGFATAEFPVIPVEPSDMAKALIEYILNPIPVNHFEKPSWEISHNKLQRLYTAINAVEK